jgi:hypothetical protein
VLTARTPLAALAAALVLVALAACGGGHSTSHDAATSIDASTSIDAGVDADLSGYLPQPPVDIPPPPPPLDTSGFPTDEQGRPVYLAGPHYYLTERAPDALTARSDCTAMIVRCVDPSAQGHNLDACVTSTPRCASAQPWLEPPCCPTVCVDRYVELRTAHTPPITAFRRAFYRRPSCAPGVDVLLGGAP